MNEKINITKKELLELLEESFDQGFGGYQELKDSTTKKILNKHLKNNKKNNKEITIADYNSSINIANYNKNVWNKDVWASSFSGTAFPMPSMTSALNSNDTSSFVVASTVGTSDNSIIHINPNIIYE